MKDCAKRYLVVFLAFTLLVLAGCAASGPSVPAASDSQPNGVGDMAQEDLTPALDQPSSDTAPVPQTLPEDGHFSIPATNVSGGMLLMGSELLETDGFWVTDQATGRVMGLCEPMRRDRTPHGCRLYDLDGGLLWEDARAQNITAVLGRWAFVCTGDYDYGDGWAVNLDTGEERFRGCELGGEAAPGVFIINHAASLEVSPADPPCLVNAQMEILRRFEGYTTLGQRSAGLVMPGYLVLHAVDNTTRLYDIARDEILPGGFDWFVDPQQRLAQFSTGEGTAVFQLDTREQLSEWDRGDTPRRYIAYGPDFKLYGQANLEYRRQEYYAERGGEAERILFAAYTAGGYYMEQYAGSAGQLDTTAQLVDASGRLLQTLEPHNGASVTSESWRGYKSNLPNFTLRLWQGGYELIGKDGVVLQGQAEGYAGLDCFSGTRYVLYTEYCEQTRFSLLNEEGTVLLEGLDQLLPTEVPGIWAVQQGFTVGLMNEAGSWLWSMDVSP